MPRFSDFSERFDCPYHTGCPYLEGLPAKWVWDRHQSTIGSACQYEYQLEQKDKEIAALKKERDDALKERDEARAQCQALHRRQFKARRKKKTEEAPGQTTGEPKKKRGAPKGHPPWNRTKPKKVDQVVEVAAPLSCPCCHNQDLKPSEEIHEHMQEDIVLVPRTVVTAYRHRQSYCTHCDRLVHQLGPNELEGAYIGPVAKATAAYLRQELRISYRKASRLFKDLFGLDFVPASAYGFDRQAARRGQPLYGDLLDKIPFLDCVHADETSWRHDGQNYWVWFAGSADLAAFLWQSSRSTQAAQQILSQKLDGVLVSDAFKSYNGIEVKDRQLCLAHIKRTAKELEAELLLLKPNAQDGKAIEMCREVQLWVKDLCHEARMAGPWRAASQKKKEKQYLERLNKICSCKLRHERTETFRKRLVGKDQRQLVTFLRHPNVPPTNNLAEQALRPVVIMRKVIQSTRSEKGLDNHSILRSLFETACRQGKNVRDFFETLFTKDTTTAQAALYRNSS
jgi:transposase